MEASFSLRPDDVVSRHSKPAGEVFPDKIVVKQFSHTNIGILGGADPELDSKNTKINSEMNKAAEKRKLHRIAKVQDLLEMWQGSQNLRATQKESCTQHKQITMVLATGPVILLAVLVSATKAGWLGS